jgi:flagellar motor protein MotB
MAGYRQVQCGIVVSLGFLLLAGTGAFAQSAPNVSSGPGEPSNSAGQDSQTIQIQSEEQQQKQTNSNSKPLPLQPGVPGMGRNHRLILKDGSYQMVRDYKIAGDRVRFLSQERGEWEELPVNLVDWDATKKWEKEHADLVEEDTSPAMKEAEEIDKEESEERQEQNARMPKVAEGLELPDEDGVFVLDTFHGTQELVELNPTDLSLQTKNRKGIAVLNPLATQKASLELEGAHARVFLHVNDPAIYVSLGVEEEKEPVLTHPMTVNTNGAKAVNGKHGAHSPQSGFVIVRADERQAVRVVGAVHVSSSGTVTQDENTIPTKVEMMPGKHWLKIEPQDQLKIGEYALVEIISPTDISESVWDFRVDPTLPDNRGAIGPILPRARDQ